MLLCRSTLLVSTTLVAMASSWLFPRVAATMSDAECDAFVLDANRIASIGAFDDHDCLNDKNSVGCFANTCRFCRWATTEQSRHFVHCDATTRQLEAMKTEVELYCPPLVSSGDQAVGITAYFDSGCPTARGGLGCQDNKCRLCKTRTTPQSQAYEDCPQPSTDTSETCATAVTQSQLTSIDFVNNAKCNVAEPQLVGCVAKTKCRLCRNDKNEGNQYLVSCKVLRETATIEFTALAATDDSSAVATESSHEIVEVSAAAHSSAESIDTSLVIRAAQKTEDARDTTDEKDDNSSYTYTWIAVGGAMALAAAGAVMAIRKSRRRRLDAMKTPRTPMDPTSLISVHTCIATL